IPLLIIILVLGYVLLPDVSIQKKDVMDIPSVIMSTIGFGALLYGLVSAGNNKLLAVETFVPILIGVIVIYFYVIRQMKLEVPMLNFRVYKYRDRKSTRLNSSHVSISYAVFCLKKNRSSQQ